MEKPLKRRIFVFAVRERSRLRTMSGLYVPNSTRGMLTRAEDIWVLNAASDCVVSKWTKGQHLLIADGFELEPTNMDLWEKYSQDPEFDYLRKIAVECEAKVITLIVHEDSILGEVEGDLLQDEPQW